MEEAVLHDLLDIVVDQLAADLAKIVTLCEEFVLVIHRTSADVFHNKHTRRRILVVELGTANVIDPLVVAGKFLHVGGFLEEIHLLLRCGPQFIQNHLQVHHILESADRGKNTDCSL